MFRMLQLLLTSLGGSYPFPLLDSHLHILPPTLAPLLHPQHMHTRPSTHKWHAPAAGPLHTLFPVYQAPPPHFHKTPSHIFQVSVQTLSPTQRGFLCPSFLEQHLPSPATQFSPPAPRFSLVLIYTVILYIPLLLACLPHQNEALQKGLGRVCVVHNCSHSTWHRRTTWNICR